MSADLRVENILIQVRCKLQENGVKLWLQPYYAEGIGSIEAELETLSRDYCQVLNIPYDYTLAAITELQNNAIDKIRARDEFTETGLATIKVRAPNQVGGTRLVTVQIQLTELGSILHDRVAKELGVSPMSIKLISSGRVLNGNRTLSEQGIANNQMVMAIALLAAEASSDDNDIYERFNRAKQDATLLSSPDQNQFMDMEDQEGNAIHLPPNERQSLMLALAMHEKGKSALQRDAHSEALVFLLDADNEYKMCNSKLLESVDNYALLNLDIAWCYLCLRSVTQLPDAEQRLLVCERNFKKSYGDNLDRVVSLKGNAGNEKALMLRLHLLQGVLYFHQNRRGEALAMLSMAERELRALKVNDGSLAKLVEMGYTASEGRLGLRAGNGDVEAAVAHITEMREARRTARQRSRRERELAGTVNGGGLLLGGAQQQTDDLWVNPRTLSSLIEMGFAKEMATIALRKSENDITRAIAMLQDNSAELRRELAADTTTEDSLIKEITNMGFNAEIVRIALQSVDERTVDRIVEVMLKMQNDGSYEESLATLLASTTATSMDAVGACSSSHASANHNLETIRQNIQKHVAKHAETKEAFDRFSEGVSKNDDEYLDLPLVQEEQILLEYKQFLGM